MTRRTCMLILPAVAMMLAALVLAEEAPVNLPVGGGAAGIEGFKLVPTGGVTAKLSDVAKADGGRSALKIGFTKAGDERRLLAVAAPLHGNPTGAHAVALRSRLDLGQGKTARLAVALLDAKGNTWYKIGPQPTALGKFADALLSLNSLQAAAFNEAGAKFDWAKIRTVWLGVVLDAPASGSLEISNAHFTSEAYHASAPLLITKDPMAMWSVDQDPRVQHEIAIVNEGPGGKPCVCTHFTFPLGSHMYMLPHTPIPAADLEGYRALRFTYRAKLPQGITGVLVTLWERGGAQYEEANYPPASADWKTVTLPFDTFHLAGWSKDSNNHFDIGDLTTVMVGVHGTATGGDGKGELWVTDVELVP